MKLRQQTCLLRGGSGLAALVLLAMTWQAAGAEEAGHSGPACSAVDPFFADEVWAKVGERTCLKCHRAEGDAAESEFLLEESARNRLAIHKNQAAFVRMARQQEGETSRLLAKATGGLDHGGGEVLAPTSTGLKILERFVARATDSIDKAPEITAVDDSPLLEGVNMISDQRLLRRATLSLAGRLPTDEERDRVNSGGLEALDGILDRLMTEDAFYHRLKEGFNDIFLTLGYDGNGEEVLSYDHFQKSRLWYQKYDLSDVPEKEQQRARWHLADVYREAMKREPLELIAYIVRNDRPFTELVTADYILVSPYTARGYGVFEDIEDQFQDPDDPFEYIPTQLPALTSRNGKVQESPTGIYPHAGLLSTFHYLRRYPTTETNRNRLRARMYYQHFLGIDVMELAPRVSDAAAITAKYEIPTMQAADCVVCHRTIDPVAGLFQDYNEGGHLGPRKEGWYTDMFAAGLEGDDLPEEQRWRAMQWLGERTAKDPRFAATMVEHVYYLLMGRRVLLAPEDIDDPLFTARRKAHQQQRRLIADVAAEFTESDFNLKTVFKALIKSDFYRADGLAMLAEEPQRQAELDDIGLVRLLTPEQLERKIAAVFGEEWGQLTHRESKYKILYGGIDSKEVTERITEPNGVMGAIQRLLSNDVPCKHVAVDFSKPPDERILFPDIEIDVLPDDGPAAEEQIRRAIVHLHSHLLGREDAINDPEVERTYQLFRGIVNDAKDERVEKQATYFCGRVDGQRLDDPHYTLRAWRAVVTYLLRQQEFLYE